MALAKNIKQFFFGKGLETKVEQSATPIGKLHMLENGWFQSVGKIKKMFGLTAMVAFVKDINSTGPATLPALTKLGTYKNELLAVGTNPLSGNADESCQPESLFSYSDQFQNWLDKGGLAGISVTSLFCKGSGGWSKIINTDLAYGSDVVCLVEQSENLTDYALQAFLLDSNTGVILKKLELDTGTALRAFRVIAVGSDFYVFYFDAATDLKVYKIDGGTLLASGPQLVISDGANIFDVSYNSANSLVLVSYTIAAAAGIRYNTYSSASLISGSLGVALSTVATANSAEVPTVIACHYTADNNNWHIAYSRTANSRSICFTSALAAVTAVQALFSNETEAIIFTSPTDSPFAIIGADVSSNASNFRYLKMTTAGVDDGSEVVIFNVGADGHNYRIASRSFYYNSRNFFCVYTPEGDSRTSIAIVEFDPDATDGPLRLVGSCRVGESLLGEDFYVGGAAAISSTKFAVSTIKKNSNSKDVSSVTIIDFSPQGKLEGVEIAEGYYFAGNFHYDGHLAKEVGFLHSPVITSLTESAGGALDTLGVYSYTAIYTYQDSQGRIHRSAPAEPVGITLTGANQSVEVEVRNIGLTNKTNVKIEIYRTEASGTVYYLLPGIRDVPNVRSDSISSLNDEAADSAIIDQEILYTLGGELESYCPPPSYAICAYKDRVVLLTDQGIWYSKKVEESDPVEFNDALVITNETTGGRETALAVLDDKLLIFKADRIYYINGDGPNETGTFGEFSAPQLISKEYGCLYPQAVLSTGREVWFQARQGLMKIDSSLNVQFVGIPLDYHFSEDSVVTSMDLFNNDSQIRILTSSAMFMYDQTTGEWSMSSDRGARDQVQWGKYYVTLNSSHLPLLEDETTFQVNGSFATLKVRTGWIQLDAIQGYQRCRRAFILGRYSTAHTLTVNVFYDYVPKIAETFTFNPSAAGIDVSTFTDANVFGSSAYSGNANPYQVEMHLKYQKCQSIRFEIYDGSQAGIGESLELVALSLELGLKDLQPKSRAVTKI